MQKIYAKCINKETILVELEVNGKMPVNKIFTLIENGIAKEVPSLRKEYTQHQKITYELRLRSPLQLGNEYALSDEHYETVYLDLFPLLDTPEFDEEQGYDGHDLGMRYHKSYTEFRLWSPLASHARVLYTFQEKTYEQEMVRLDHGVFFAEVKGDLELSRYVYVVRIQGEERTATDPYAVASTQNGTHSVVVDLKKTDVDEKRDHLPAFHRYTDAVIYETSVRDLTSYQESDVTYKGTFLGAAEKGRRSTKGMMVGIDHLIRLGITHVQFLPIFDFATVDETDRWRLYNWGYDPMQYNVPEGSYASVPEDPYSRIADLKVMVSAFHEAGIRVNMDVVYNHVYDQKSSPFEILCPHYYFRRKKDGTLSNGSFCGNDLASERKMVRQFIVDSCLYWIKEYSIDGLRFDLMGILDIDTMLEIEKKCREIRPDIMIYGEGWNMPTELPHEKKAMMDHAKDLPHIAFFNDSYREIVKGKTFESEYAEKGYLLGQENYIEGFKYVYMGSCIDYCFPPRFQNLSQSINYVECHDNGTLYDKISVACPHDSHEQRLRRVVLVNEVILLSYGIPFIHMGQEIGLTKFHDHNSYRSGDRFNQMDYQKLEERKWMVKCMNDIILIRKTYPFLRIDRKEELEVLFRFENLDHGGLLIDFVKKEAIAPYEHFKIFINPSIRTIYYDLKDYHRVLFNEAGILKDEMYSQSLMINGLTVVIVAK